jgi:hypothetical protein
MEKTILTFGLISGAISALMMAVTVPFAHKITFNKSLVLGYTTIVLSFLLVYFGIRSYHDNAGNGQITFTKAFTASCKTKVWRLLELPRRKATPVSLNVDHRVKH